MLLRLVPAPTPANPQPPTILFSLQLPQQPYTAKGLPLPSSLINHRAVCDRQGIECPNPLLGDKATWLAGIVHEVSFFPANGTIKIQLMINHDEEQTGEDLEMPLVDECRVMCEAVMDHVTKSFAPQPSPTLTMTAAPLSPPPTPHPTVSIENKRSRSSLLMSLLSPLLPSSAGFGWPPSPSTCQGFITQQHSAPHQGKPTTPSVHQRIANPQRYHRKHARSVLVDTFARFVIPFLKNQLPVSYLHRSAATTSNGSSGTSGYLAIAVAVDVQNKQREWSRMKSEIEQLLLPVPIPVLESVRGQGLRRPSLGRRDTSDQLQKIDWNALDTTVECEGSAPLSETASTETITVHLVESTCATRTTYFSSLPSYTTLPVRVRQRYATVHKRFGDHTSRLNALEQFDADLAEEERRRAQWESEEMDRVEEKARRRASVGVGRKQTRCTFALRLASGLRHCVYSASDDDDLESTALEMKETIEESLHCDTTLVDEFSADIQVRPISPCSLVVHGCSPCSTSALDLHDRNSDSGSEYSEEEDAHSTGNRYRHREIATEFEGYNINTVCAENLVPPGLVYARSAESFDSDDSTICCGSPADDDEEGEARRQRLRSLSDDAISEGLFVFPPKQTTEYRLAPQCFSPSPLLDPIVIVPPSPLQSIVETSHHHHTEEEQDREDPMSMRMDELWVDVLSGRRKSTGAATATAAPGNAGGFFGWLQQQQEQQQQHVTPSGAAVAC
ncbi:hypothetical protein QFC22_003684 [Naganishia vaughanmartiniae]|uniref:Uncharacterized protein n=1 Tax=Naganishia vaughanmartiniae TaxID=1424756 RepID=A0ACC2X8T9_9TREE|nr:hypothetical protein QFC22_003684 [Naganishia vaughanmartiniae]